jgi:4'-phosphopantetheinyl transferase
MPLVVEWCFTREGAGERNHADALASLVPAERQRFDGFRVEKRRREWLLGRVTAKALLAKKLRAHAGVDVPASSIEIARASSGAPVARLAEHAPPGLPWAPGSRLPVRVSVSHSHGAALCGMLWLGEAADLATAPRLGVDLEWIEPRTEGFVRDFLTGPEHRYWSEARGDERDFRANLVWSAKEAVLKVIERGLSVDTWWLTCLPSGWTPADPTAPHAAPRGRAELSEASGFALEPDTGEWGSFRVSTDPRLPGSDLAFAGRYRTIEGFVATVAVGAPSGG